MLIFVSIALAGFIILLMSALFGGHEFGDHEVHIEHGADTDQELGGPNPLSIRVISLFVTAFGASGAIAKHYDLSYMVSSLVGVGCGFVVATLGFLLIRMFWKQQATSTVGADDVIGTLAEVKTAIPADGSGQVLVVVKGQRLQPLARTKDGKAVPEGAFVKIIEFVGDSATVEPVADAQKPQ